MTNNVNVQVVIEVEIPEIKFNLTKEEAEELYNALKIALNKTDTIDFPIPAAPKNPREYESKSMDPRPVPWFRDMLYYPEGKLQKEQDK